MSQQVHHPHQHRRFNTLLSIGFIMVALAVLVNSSSSLTTATTTTVWQSVMTKFYNASVMKLIGICGACSIPEGTNPSSIFDNFIVNSGMEQNMNVHYFALSENQGPLNSDSVGELQVIIDQVLSKPTIIVISSESYTTNIVFSITNTYATVKSNFLTNIRYILVNSKFKANFKFKDESLASRVTVKYYCDDLCGSDTFISNKDAFIWNSGGLAMELEMRQRIGANYTTYIGCQKSSSFTFMNPINNCETGDTNLIIAVVLSVVLGGGCLACICTCLLSILGCVIKAMLS